MSAVETNTGKTPESQIGIEMTSKTLSAALLAMSLTAGLAGSAIAQTTPDRPNNATQGAPGGDSSGNAATGSGAAPSGK